MNIKELITSNLVLKDGIYFVDGHSMFNYSDGDSEEDYIYQKIRCANDISSMSRELELSIRDWPSRYHLSRERTLAYRSINLPPMSTVLEIGSGCGSITRFLGENVAQVIALEGSPRRAAITRERTRDLSNVMVVCGSFEDVIFRQTFDIVVCNGVLEYASLFVTHSNPPQHLLHLIAKVTSQTGILIIAIENQFGLRYFSSSKEEHTNIMFDGIEGYATHVNGPKTFGRTELKNLLYKQFPYVETLIPLPDYKLPNAIIREDFLKLANCAELFANTASQSYGSFVVPHMYERFIWHELAKNNLMGELANSYMMIAMNSPSALFPPDWLGNIYSIRRKPALTTQTIFFRTEAGIYSKKEYLECEDLDTGEARLYHMLDTSKWSDGISIHTLIARNLKQRGPLSLYKRIQEPIHKWWITLEPLLNDDGMLDGAALDYNWQNTLVCKNNVSCIDREWVWNGPIHPCWLIVRSVEKFCNDELFYSHLWDKSCRNITPIKLIRAVAHVLGMNMSTRALIWSVDSELAFQYDATNRRYSKYRILLRMYIPMKIRLQCHLSKSLMRNYKRKFWQFKSKVKR